MANLGGRDVVHRGEKLVRTAADILVRLNLMSWNAAVYCTQVDPCTDMAGCAAPWFSWTRAAAWTLPAALLQG